MAICSLSESHSPLVRIEIAEAKVPHKASFGDLTASTLWSFGRTPDRQSMILVRNQSWPGSPPGVSPSSGCGIGSCGVPRPSLADHVIGTGATRGDRRRRGWCAKVGYALESAAPAKIAAQKVARSCKISSTLVVSLSFDSRSTTIPPDRYTRGWRRSRVDAHRFGTATQVVEAGVVEREAREIFWPRPAHPLRRRTCSRDLAWAGRRLHSASFEAPSVSEFLDRLGASRLASEGEPVGDEWPRLCSGRTTQRSGSSGEEGKAERQEN